MKINPISVYSNYNINNIRNSNISHNINNNRPAASNNNFAYMPVSFTGGKSQDLTQTFNVLKDEDYLPGSKLKESIATMVLSGNPQNKTLIDVHKEYFKKLKQCKTLDEAKQYYPEFKDVKSDKEVKSTKFIQEVKKDKIKGFKTNEDVALQILQLYWAEGCSTADLKNNYADKDITGTFITLNIPRTTNNYGLYLKLSDKDFNTRFSTAISERMKEIEKEKQEGKYGINPEQGADPNEIINGLKRLSSDHPDKINDLSQKLINFNTEHEEIGNTLSVVMYRAWSYPEALPVREALSKTIKTNINKEVIEESMQPKTPVNIAFKNFWQQNEWTKPIMSMCIKKAWAEHDVIMLDNKLQLNNNEYAPIQLKDKINEFFQKRSPNLAKYADSVLEDADNEKLSEDEKKAKEIIDVFFKENPVEKRNLLYSRLYGILSAFKDFAIMNVQSKGEKFSDLNKMVEIYENNITNNREKGIKKENIDALYTQLMQYCTNNNPLAKGIIKRRINADYESISKMKKEDILKYGDSASKEFIKYMQENNS